MATETPFGERKLRGTRVRRLQATGGECDVDGYSWWPVNQELMAATAHQPTMSPKIIGSQCPLAPTTALITQETIRIPAVIANRPGAPA